MKKKYFLSIYIFIALTSPVFPQLNYYPLNIGDYQCYWNYSTNEKFYSHHFHYVFDTITSDSKKYYLISDGILDTIRKDENKNVIFMYMEKERIRYRLNANPGDTWIDEYNGDTLILLSVKDTVRIGATLYSNCYKYGVNYPSEKYTWLAPDIGIIKITNKYLLANYRLGGKNYTTKNKNTPQDLPKITNSDYFPAGIGNYYYYIDGKGIQKIRIFIDSISYGGKNYYRFTDGNIDTVRVEENGDVYYKDRKYSGDKISGDQLYFRLNVPDRTKWESYDYSVYKTFEYVFYWGPPVKIGENLFEDIKSFSITQPNERYSRRSFRLYLGVGIVEETYYLANLTIYENYVRELIYSRINGVKFPLTTKAPELNHNIPCYNLYQNYPNPFNPSTVINYELKENGFVSLKVYDVLGREIKTLVNENKNKGRYNITFDAGNLSGGVYFYELRTGNRAIIKKMLVIK